MSETEENYEKKIDPLVLPFYKNPLWENVIKLWGPQLQTLVAIEEMAELTKELVKWQRKGLTNKEAILDECADVYIMILQILKMSQNETGFFAKIEEKIRRLEKRIAELSKKS